MANEKTITFRNQLSGQLTDLLLDEGMSCVETGQALVELVVALSRYQEEGVLLFPRVVLCDDLALVLSVVQGSDSIEVGVGPKGPETMRKALKKCAPLAQGGWAIYIHRHDDRFFYGVFRDAVTPMALDLRDGFGDLGKDVGVLLASQLGDKTVELVGGRGNRLVIHLSAVRDNHPSPRKAVECLATSVSRGAAESIRESLESYLRSTLSDALQRGHGALVAVLKSEIGIPAGLAADGAALDGVKLDCPIDLAAAVFAQKEGATSESLSRLLAYSKLLEGMLSVDGITLLGEDGKIYGYNVFVRAPAENGNLPSNLIGGARRRAFRCLQALVQQKQLAAAFFRSSDGGAEYSGGQTQ